MAKPLPVAWLNGGFVPLTEARISPLDRGFLFGDAVYEVVPLFESGPRLLDAHIARLGRSLAAIRLENPYSDEEWSQLIADLAARNGGGAMSIYLQVSRGADDQRDHVFPKNVAPTVFAMATELKDTGYLDGVSAITLPDERWKRCDIKSTALIANVLARQKAAEAGAIDAILIDADHVTEGAVSSVILVEDGQLVRRPHGTAVLPGTTTDQVVRVARDAGYRCKEELITVARLLASDEVWLTGATKGIAPVVRVDDRVIGTGRPGDIWRVVNALYLGQVPAAATA